MSRTSANLHCGTWSYRHGLHDLFARPFDRASSWLATLLTMTSTSTSLNQIRRHDGSGSTRWTRLRRWTRARSSHLTSDRKTRTIRDHRTDPAIHPRFRTTRGNDEDRAGALRQDVGAVSEAGESRVGALEFGPRRERHEPWL